MQACNLQNLSSNRQLLSKFITLALIVRKMYQDFQGNQREGLEDPYESEFGMSGKLD